MEIIKVAITDDHNLICEGMEKIVNAHSEMKMILTANSCNELLNKLQLCHKDLPDILLLDIEMPEISGIETLAKIKKLYPSIKVIMLSYHDEPHYIMHLIEKGVCGYIHKNCNSSEVLTTIRKVKESGKHFNEKVSVIMSERLEKNYRMQDKFKFNNKQLTKSEIKILEYICQEMTTQEIADHCNISYRTVESHKYSIFKKTAVDNKIGLMKFAIANGFYNPDKAKK